MNDREMLERCDEAIVMGNARHPEVKELATYITGGVLEDGIAQAMRHFGLVS
jgi:hydroxymethylpyrimidine pyrophosphatase-like HAD family hydrolase